MQNNKFLNFLFRIPSLCSDEPVLGAQGVAQRLSIRFVTDGGDTGRNLQQHLHGEAEHWLDWFHITMRITVMRQMAKSITSEEVNDLPARIDRDLGHANWLLWHGNHVDGSDAAVGISWELELAGNKDAATKLDKALGEFSGYIHKAANYLDLAIAKIEPEARRKSPATTFETLAKALFPPS